MTQDATTNGMIPTDAQCLSCGYALRGLPAPVCPECGRGFDPADPSTFDPAPRTRRRRRFLVRGAVAVAVLAGAAAFGPRDILKANASFTCTQCGKAEMVTRWQLNPPRWISFAYPGIESRKETTTTPSMPSNEACNHTYDFTIRTDLPIGGGASARMMGSLNSAPGTVNGAPLTFEDPSPVLRALLKPGNRGIGP